MGQDLMHTSFLHVFLVIHTWNGDNKETHIESREALVARLSWIGYRAPNRPSQCSLLLHRQITAYGLAGEPHR